LDSAATAPQGDPDTTFTLMFICKKTNQ